VLGQVHDFDKVFAVPEPLDAELAAGLEYLSAALCEFRIAHFFGHFLACPQCGQI